MKEKNRSESSENVEERIVDFDLEKVVIGLLDFLKRGLIDECVEIFARCPVEVLPPFIQAAREESLLKDVGNVLFRAKKYAEAAALSAEQGEELKAAMLYERAGFWEKSARLFAKIGDEERAASLFAQAGISSI